MSRLLRKLVFCNKTDTVSSVGEGARQWPECAVCQDVPRKPCTVPCGNRHVFCQACLQGIITHSQSRSSFPCPLCRQQVWIPLSGLGAFRQDKAGGCMRLLAYLPDLLAGRCRRRRNSTDSFSSGWPDNLSLSSLGTGAVFEQRVWFPDSDSDDDNSDIIEYGSSGDSLGEDLMVGLNEDLSDGDSVVDPEQLVILQSLIGGLQGRVWRPREDPTAQNGDESAHEGGEEEGRPSEAMAELDTLGDDDLADVLPDIFSSSPDDLDMTVVLQIIADMERNDCEQSGHSHATSAVNTQHREDAKQESVANSPSRGAGSPETSPKSIVTEGSPVNGTQQIEVGNWKLRTIADTAIPRPKLTFAHDASTGKGSVIQLQDNEDHLQLGGLGHLPQQVSSLAGSREGEAESPLSLGKGVLQLVTSTSYEVLRVDQIRSQKSLARRASHESSVREVHQNPQIKSRLSAGHVFHLDSAKYQVELPLLDLLQKYSCPLRTADPQEDQYSGPTLLTQTSLAVEDHDSQHWHRPQPSTSMTTRVRRAEGRLPPEKDLSPEGWRRQELQKLQHAKSRAAGLQAKTLAAEAEVCLEDPRTAERDVISEGPCDWVRRIRSLQHRRRSLGRRPALTRSLSHMGSSGAGDGGGKTAATQSVGWDGPVVEGLEAEMGWDQAELEERL